MPACKVLLASGGDPRVVTVNDNVSVSTAISAAGVEFRLGDQVLVNGKTVNPEKVNVHENDLVILARPLEGG